MSTQNNIARLQGLLQERDNEITQLRQQLEHIKQDPAENRVHFLVEAVKAHIRELEEEDMVGMAQPLRECLDLVGAQS